MKKFIETILLLAATFALFCAAMCRALVYADVESLVLLTICAVCLWVWADELIRRLRAKQSEKKIYTSQSKKLYTFRAEIATHSDVDTAAFDAALREGFLDYSRRTGRDMTIIRRGLYLGVEQTLARRGDDGMDYLPERSEKGEKNG